MTKKVSERLSRRIPEFQSILANARDRDINESDTVTIITDMLAGMFGFDKYAEVTSEQAIRGTYCDLAVMVDGKVRYLIEVKAIGLTLKDNHLRQAVNYGANHGVQWVVLTNAVQWDLHRIKFERPISSELVCSIDFLGLSARKEEDLERLFLLCREGVNDNAIEQYHEHVQNVNRFVVGALIQTEPVLAVIRRELRRLEPTSRVSIEEVRALLPDVLKREVLEGEQAVGAEKRISRASSKALRRTRADSAPTDVPAVDGSPLAADEDAPPRPARPV